MVNSMNQSDTNKGEPTTQLRHIKVEQFEARKTGKKVKKTKMVTVEHRRKR
jgi:hypothetical protein